MIARGLKLFAGVGGSASDVDYGRFFRLVGRRSGRRQWTNCDHPRQLRHRRIQTLTVERPVQS